jgi:hypothetical protein
MQQSFLKCRRVVFDSQLQLTHGIIAVASDEIRCRTVGNADLLGEIFDSLPVLHHTLVTDSTIVQILQVFRISQEGLRVV